MNKYKLLLVALLATSLIAVSGCMKVRKDLTYVKTYEKKLVLDPITKKYIIVMVPTRELTTRRLKDKGSVQLPAYNYRKFNKDDFFQGLDVIDRENVMVSLVSEKKSTDMYGRPLKKVVSDIWIIDKTGKKRLTKSNDYLYTPSFSSDGKYSYFTKGKLGSMYLWKTKTSGDGGLIRIAQSSYEKGSPKESPDGKKILYVEADDYGSEASIWVSENDGRLPVQVAEGLYPSWKDKQTITYSAMSDSSRTYSIYSTSITGRNQTEIVSDPNFHAIMPSADPKGRFIAFVSYDKKAKTKRQQNESKNIILYDTKNGSHQQITTLEGRDDLPKWSSDGSYLYFRSARGGEFGVWRIHVNSLRKS